MMLVSLLMVGNRSLSCFNDKTMSSLHVKSLDFSTRVDSHVWPQIYLNWEENCQLCSHPYLTIIDCSQFVDW